MRLTLLALLLVTAPASAQDARDALESGDLICEIRHPQRSRLVADLSGTPPAADLLLVFESVTPDAARVVSSQRPGKHPVQVRVAGEVVHFLEQVGPSLRHTALTRCLRMSWKNGYPACVRYSARHAWHFDTSALADPAAALARLAHSVSVGVCEPWQID